MAEKNTRILSFDVCTHTVGYLCKSNWQSARPHYLSANRGHVERQQKTLQRPPPSLTQTKGVSGLGDTRSREEVDPLSGAVLCRLVEQILLWPPELVPLTTSPPRTRSQKERVKILLADFLMEKRGNWKSPADSWPPLRVFHKAGWALPRRRGR